MCVTQVGKYVQIHCKLDENPYLRQLNEVGGTDRVLEALRIGDAEGNTFCETILRYCDLVKENEEALLPKILCVSSQTIQSFFFEYFVFTSSSE